MNIDKKFKHVIKRLNVKKRFNINVIKQHNSFMIMIHYMNHRLNNMLK